MRIIVARMSNAVQQIKDRLTIVDVISPYVELHKAGKNFKGKSPFTNEKTPSFYVSPERGMYYCFSTSQGGDMFTFIEVMEGVDFKGALKILADKARVELVPVSPEKQNERDRLFALLEAVTNFYVTQLKLNETAMAYVKDRGVTADTIASWRIGYAPGPPVAGWRATKEYLIGKGFTVPELLSAGLVKTAGDGKEPYDVFRNRVMFPLFDQSGRVVGFSGRTLEQGSEIPKYVNSPETELYKKSELLYGYDRAKHGIRQLDFSLLVEGQFDVVMSHQAGYSNTVAVSGTALTPFHVQLLERLSPKVVLALDADKAGMAAAKRAADIMLRRGMDVKVARLSRKDPADLIREDPKEFKRAIGGSVHVIEWLMDQLLALALPSRTLKLRAREEVIPFIALLPNKIDQDHFEQVVATSLGTTQAAVKYEVERCLETAHNTGAAQNTEKETGPAPVAASTRTDTLLVYLLSARALATEPIPQRLTEALTEITGQSPSELEATLAPTALAESLFRTEMQLASQPTAMFVGEVLHALNQYRTAVIKAKLAAAKSDLQQAELAGEAAAETAALAAVQAAQQALRVVPYDQAWLLLNEVKP